MQQFLQTVNQSRLMLVFQDESEKGLAQVVDRECGDRYMDVRDQVAIRFDGQKVVERRGIVEVERLNLIEFVELLGSHDTFGCHVVGQDLWLMAKRQVAGHTDQNEGDSHEWAVGIERPGDDGDKEKEYDDAGAWPEFEWVMLRGIPVEKDLSVLRRERVSVPFGCGSDYWSVLVK